ncbi:hypothetical protein GHT06_001917 [Daphnia sinensis]|uniref:Transposase domain-containing protein n=2 Tax=Daphnia sinensis TaxID=1820382 RepID=A0AAD5PQ29_9CRUS|nr:hypothetical protein GHT06_001917 [Daphnia sinensis]
MIGIVNARLNKIKPPYEITRSTGDIDDIPNWKASMFRAFGLYYFQILEGLLVEEYFEHFSNLMYGLYGLLQERISVKDVKNVEVLFKKFVTDMELLYGGEHVGINIHFLVHLPQSVLDWGCLWTTSTFIPEWFNGHLLTLCNGTQSQAEQMAHTYLLKHAVRDEFVTLLKSTDAIIPPTVSSLLIELLHLPLDTREELIEKKSLLTKELLNFWVPQRTGS